MNITFNAERHEYTVNGVKVPSVTDICSILTQGKYQINPSILHQASARGTRVHELCQLMDYDVALLEEEDVEPEIVGYLQAWMQFERDYSPKWNYVEHMMYDSRLGVAGTTDRIGVIDKCPCIVDIKTTSSMDRNSQIALALQLVGYGMMSPVPVGLVEGMGVQLKADGSYKVYRVKDIQNKYNFCAVDMFNQLIKIYKFANLKENE